MNINIKAMRVYSNMLSRCYEEKHQAWMNYGGRGINVSDQWINDPTAFLNWYKQNYFDGCQIDRIDVNSGYSQENCRMVTPKVNSRNRRNTRFLTAFGETKSYSEWLEDSRAGSGLTLNCIVSRLDNNWMAEDVITVNKSEIRGQNPRAEKLSAFNETKTLYEWVKDPRCVVDKNTLFYRKKSGWDFEKALTQMPASNSGILYCGRSVLQWSKDPRCQVSYKVLNSRLKKGIALEQALLAA